MPKSNAKVHHLAPDFYTTARGRRPAAVELRESHGPGLPGERLLQCVWLQQRLRRDALRTLDGRPVTVVHPGFWNREAGPDFRDALIRLGDAPAATCDVEIDLTPAAWRQHRHDRNPAYARVGLHVVWQATGPPEPDRATMAIANLIDSPLAELQQSLTVSAAERVLLCRPGRCAAGFRAALPETTRQFIEQAALERLRQKAGQIEARARHAGWTQALWEVVFTALGYKHNAWPMRRLAELLPVILPEPHAVSAHEALVRLLGVGGLLPGATPRRDGAAQAWLAHAWAVWWRLRESLLDLVLPAAAWRFDGIRPANHPQRRLALVAHWLTHPGWVESLDAWLAEDLPETAWLPALHRRLQPPVDDFWSRHWTLRSAASATPLALIGTSRITDLALNALLPWFRARAHNGRQASLVGRVERRFLSWPAAQDNATLRLARQRLLPGVRLGAPRRAALQQGLIQLTRDFCAASTAACEGCPLPGILAELV